MNRHRNERAGVERLLYEHNKDKRVWHMVGFCEACGRASTFAVDMLHADGGIPNWRERLVCRGCGLANRSRFMAGYLLRLGKEGGRIRDVYLCEQVSPLYQWARTHTGLRITGSEYLGREKRPGELVGRIRHEDALRLSFGDRSFDLVVSADVYEHVQDIHQALKETLRVLRDEGTLLFSVPFHVGEDVTRQRAKVEGGVVIPLMPEIYHGDPLSPKGSLVVYDFGWDILHTCRDAGFADAYMLAYYSMWYGYIGHAVQIVFVAEKRPRGTGAAARWSDRIPQP